MNLSKASKKGFLGHRISPNKPYENFTGSSGGHRIYQKPQS